MSQSVRRTMTTRAPDATSGRIGGIIAAFSPRRRAEFDRLVAGGMRPSKAADKMLDIIEADIERRLGK